MQIIQELTLPTMSLTRVLINGSMGRMGQESIKAVSEDPELELVAQTDLGDNLSESISQSNAHAFCASSLFTPSALGTEVQYHRGSVETAPVLGK